MYASENTIWGFKLCFFLIRSSPYPLLIGNMTRLYLPTYDSHHLPLDLSWRITSLYIINRVSFESAFPPLQYCHNTEQKYQVTLVKTNLLISIWKKIPLAARGWSEWPLCHPFRSITATWRILLSKQYLFFFFVVGLGVYVVRILQTEKWKKNSVKDW